VYLSQILTEGGPTLPAHGTYYGQSQLRLLHEYLSKIISILQDLFVACHVRSVGSSTLLRRPYT